MPFATPAPPQPNNWLAQFLGQPQPLPFQQPGPKPIAPFNPAQAAPTPALTAAAPPQAGTPPSTPSPVGAPPLSGAPASPAPAPGAAPTPPEDGGVGLAGKAVQDALKARAAYQPYEAQPTDFKPPEQPKQSALSGIVNLLAASLVGRKDPFAAAAIGEGMAGQQKAQKEKYGVDYQTAVDKYKAQQANEQARERSGATHEHELDVGVDLAEKNQQQMITAQRATLAAHVAQVRADAYAQSIVDRRDIADNNRDAKVQHWADDFQFKDKELGRRLASAADLRRLSDAAALMRTNVTASTALTIATQRANISLAVEALREQAAAATEDKKLTMQTSLSATEALLKSYDNAIKAASNPLASPQEKAMAAQLLTPDPQTHQTPYQKITHDLSSKAGITVPRSDDLTALSDIRSTITSSILSGEDPSGALGGLGLGGGTQAGTTIQQFFGNTPPAAGASPAPSAAPGAAQIPAPSPTGTPAQGGAPSHYEPVMQMFGKMRGLPPGLLESVIQKGENSGVTAVSPAGAIGIAQFMPDTAKQYHVDPRDPYQSIDGAARYLHDLMTKYHGNTALAVAAYNFGPGAVDSVGGDISKMPAETQAYVARVLGGPAPAGGGQPQPAQPGAPGHQPAPGGAQPGQPPQAAQPPNPQASAHTPQQVAQSVVQRYDKDYAGTNFDAAWGAISQKLTSEAAQHGIKLSPQDMQAAEQGLRQHVQQAKQKADALRQQQTAPSQFLQHPQAPPTPAPEKPEVGGGAGAVTGALGRAAGQVGGAVAGAVNQRPPHPTEPPNVWAANYVKQHAADPMAQAPAAVARQLQWYFPELGEQQAQQIAQTAHPALQVADRPAGPSGPSFSSTMRPAGLGGDSTPRVGGASVPAAAGPPMAAAASAISRTGRKFGQELQSLPDVRNDPEMKHLVALWKSLYGRPPTAAEVRDFHLGPVHLGGM